MLLRLRYALVYPKHSRRSIIHPRSGSSEIRNLRHACVKSHSVREMLLLPSCSHPKNKNDEYCQEETVLSFGNMPAGPCSRDLSSHTQKYSSDLKSTESCKSKTPRYVLRENKLKCSTIVGTHSKCHQTRFQKRANFIVQTKTCTVPCEKRNFIPIPSKPTASRHLKSPYLVYPCVPPVKLQLNKPKVRSLLRLEQTPAQVTPQKIYLKESEVLAASKSKKPKKENYGNSRKLKCRKENFTKSLPKSFLNQSEEKWIHGRAPHCNIGRPSRCALYTRHHSSSTKIASSKHRFEMQHETLKSYPPFGIRGHSQLPPAPIKPPFKFKKKNFVKQSDIDRQQTKCSESSKSVSLSTRACGSLNKMPFAERCLNEITAKLQKLAANGHISGCVMADRLACDERLLVHRMKWNSSKSVQPSLKSKEKVELPAEIKLRSFSHCDSEISAPLESRNSKVNTKSRDTLSASNPIIAKVPSHEVTGNFLSSQVGQALQLKGNLVERVLTRFGNQDRGDKLFELAHAMIPPLQISS